MNTLINIQKQISRYRQGLYPTNVIEGSVQNRIGHNKVRVKLSNNAVVNAYTEISLSSNDQVFVMERINSSQNQEYFVLGLIPLKTQFVNSFYSV